jgi:hypothetical protein
MAEFEGKERRIKRIEEVIKKYDLQSLDNCKVICSEHGIDVAKFVKDVQPICFENAVWAYTLGTAIALTQKETRATEVTKFLGEGLDAFTVPDSVADNRKIGIGHGKLAKRLLDENTKCFCFLAGHESFAASEGAIAIAKYANSARKTPLKIVLIGLGKEPAYIIARVKGFTYVETTFDHNAQKLTITKEIKFGSGKESEVKIYGCFDALEGLAIMIHEQVDVSITGNSTDPVRFQHPVAGTYRMWCIRNGKEYFSVASGGGTGRTLHPDNVKAGPASYGLTDLMGRMHCDVQFAGSSSVPAHVDMMGFIGMGNNPIVGATVGLSVLIAETNKNK